MGEGVMESFWVFGKNQGRVDEVRKIALSMGFNHDGEKPDFIVSVGGDGMLLVSERKFPGIPKLPVRDSLVGFKCHDEPLQDLLGAVKTGETHVVETMKLETVFGDLRLLATNDIVMRNADQRHALRFEVRVDGELVNGLFIGDGLVVSTPFGSTGYYHSVTRDTFETGIGVGFNNVTNEQEPLHLAESAEIQMDIVRGEAYLAADNHPDMRVLTEGVSVTISKSEEVARFISHG
jgi:NAD+ kinase